MARVQEFYKGRRKKKNYAIVPFVILLAILSLIVVLFYGMQKYAVITKDGVSVELPILDDGTTAVDSGGNKVKSFETVDTSIVFDAPNYMTIEASAGKDAAGNDLPGVRAIFVPAENVNKDKLVEYAARLVAGNALVLEMKPRSGQLLWESHSQMATNYSLSPATEATNAMPGLIEMLKEQDIYLVAQISCCIDESLPTRTTAYCIHTEGGANYRDDVGTWLDAYNLDLRTYVAEMAMELYEMGFDEVVLSDVAHPTLEEEVPLVYTRDISTPRSTINAVCGFAVNVAQQLRDRPGALSIYVDSKPALVKDDTSTGQNAIVFMKMYDRVYIRTDRFAYSYNVDDIAPNVEVGNVYDRLVPVVENYIPQDNTSWILIDVEEEDTKKN